MLHIYILVKTSKHHQRDRQPGSGPHKITPNHTDCQQIAFKAKNGQRKQEGPKDKHITSSR